MCTCGQPEHPGSCELYELWLLFDRAAAQEARE